jgi:wyosine [tRNA(Phe)-imidazoG37] synthetase (radical SAM superfamily)
VGPRLVVWEATLGEAEERRNELESVGWSYGLEAPVTAACSEPRSIVYGPIDSRRFGRSLGIDLVPAGVRICSYDCVYCSCPRRLAPRATAPWPSPEAIADALRAALATVGALDSVTISGHGEPTLHPRFESVVENILDVARSLRPGVSVRILTNGSGIVRPEVRAALARLDETIAKLDAGVQRVSRPKAHFPVGASLAALAFLDHVTIQSCFVDGPVSNTDHATVEEWAEVVGEVRPPAVQIYTISEQPAGESLRPVAATRLEEIACVLRARTGIEARVYG